VSIRASSPYCFCWLSRLRRLRSSGSGCNSFSKNARLWPRGRWRAARQPGQTIVRSLENLLSGSGRRVAEGQLPRGEVRFTISDSGIRVDLANGVLWLPAPLHLHAAALAPFRDAEVLEFQGNADRAISQYEPGSRPGNPAAKFHSGGETPAGGLPAVLIGVSPRRLLKAAIYNRT